MSANPKKFQFILNPEPRQAQVNITQGNFVNITITAQNRSLRPVRVQAITDPIDMAPSVESEPLPLPAWAGWLSISSPEPEWDFKAGGVRQYTVRITLPANARLGTYRFRLLISGVENPDEEFDASDPISFTVVGPEMNIQPFVIGAAIILALIILAVITAALLLRPHPSLKAELEAPPNATQGEAAQYTLKITNTGAEPASNVTVDYKLPASVAAASAVVHGETIRHCDSSGRQIHCDFGSLEANGKLEVAFLSIPGPLSEVITNTRTMTVSAQLAAATSIISVKPKPSQEFTRVAPAQGPFAVALNPSTNTPIFEEDFTYQVLAWGTITTTQQISFTFVLPVGLHYVTPLPRECRHVQNDYFTLDCNAPLQPGSSRESITRVDIRAGATSVTAAPAVLNAVSSLAPDPALALKRTLQVQVVNTALFFDGVQDWAQLGYSQAPKTFTVEMWVHPFSSDDGQSFIGLHREEPDQVRNMFLAGYWFGSLQINVNGESHNLNAPKRTDRYHLAVVVENIAPDQSKVTVYINGVEQEWLEPEDPSVCDRCKIFNSALPGGPNPLPWVLGQDWDLGSQGKKTSDFFHGTEAEVQIWETALSKNQILENSQVRPQGNEPGLAAYYRLEPVTPDSDVLISRAASAPAGKRMAAHWIEAEPIYGTALRFNGFNDSLGVTGLSLQNFQPDANGQVEVTMAGWVMVDAIPSVQEWVLGSTVPTASTLGLAPGAGPDVVSFETPSASDQAALDSAKSELLAAQQALSDLGLDEAQVSANRYNARQRLILAVSQLINDAQARQSADAKVINQVYNNPIDPATLQVTTNELGVLGRSGVSQEISSTLTSLQSNLARLAGYKAELAALGQPTGGAVAAPTQPTTPEAQAASLFKSLLADAQQKLADQVTFVNNGALTDAEGASPDAPLMRASRLDEYNNFLARILGELNPLLTVLQANTAYSTTDLQQASSKTAAYLQAIQVEQAQYAAATAGLPFIVPQKVAFQARIDLLERFLQPVRSVNLLLTQASLLGIQAIPNTALTPAASAFIPALPADAQASVNRIKVNQVIFDEAVSYYTNLQSLVQGLQKAGQTALLQRTFARLSPAGALDSALAQANLYIAAGAGQARSAPNTVLDQLVQIDRQEASLVQDQSSSATLSQADAEQAGAERILAFQNLQSAQDSLTTELAALDTWMQSGLDAAFQESLSTGAAGPSDVQRNFIAALATVQYNEKRYQDAAANEVKLQAAQARLAAAQAQVDDAQAQVDAAQQAAKQSQAEASDRQALEAEVQQAELALSSAKTGPEVQAAQTRLATARTNLTKALLGQYTSLQSSIQAMRVREPALADLAPRLNNAVDRSTEAAFSAARRYNVERWIGPFLDFILGTRTPRLSAQEAIRPAALLAAQQAIKAKVDSDVDVAASELKTTLQKQNTLVNSGGNAARRQQIIDQINAYLDSLNKDVTNAQEKLNQALAAQQGDLGDSKVPLVLAEALAQTVADQVTSATIRLTPGASVGGLLSSSAVLETQAKQSVRGQISGALEAARRPLRIQLYYQTGYLIQRLNGELASRGLSAQEQKLKTSLRAQLVASNTALLRLLNAQNLLLRPSTGLNTQVGQVADASQSAASTDALLKEFEDALQKADLALQAYLAVAQTPGLSLSLPAGVSAGAAGGTSGGAAASSNSTGNAGTSGNAGTAGANGTTNTTGATGTTGTSGTAGTTGTTGTAGNAGISGAGSAGAAANAAAGLTNQPVLSNLTQSGVAVPVNPVTSTLTTTATAGAALPPNLWAGLMVDTDGHMMLVARAPSGDWTWEKDEKPLPVMQWVHYAIVLRYNLASGAITGYTLYRDGSRVKGDVSGETPTLAVDALACPASFYIGGLCDQNGRYFFAGRIDEVRVWNRALTSDEIEAWRKLPGVSYDEVAYWPFDDGPGRSATEACDPGLTCDRSPGGQFSLKVIGPSWLDADSGLAAFSSGRP